MLILTFGGWLAGWLVTLDGIKLSVQLEFMVCDHNGGSSYPILYSRRHDREQGSAGKLTCHLKRRLDS